MYTMEKDSTLATLIPNRITECALGVAQDNPVVCVSANAVAAIGRATGASGDPAAVMDAAKRKLSCDTERCVLGKLSAELGEDLVRSEIRFRLKAAGPTDTKLLSNVHIDTVLRQWAEVFPGFYPYNFNMKNYASYSYRNGEIIHSPDTLATISFGELYRGEGATGGLYKCAACVINSDTYQGPGKHWMALFVDARGPRLTVEFFNSSGNAPAPEWVNWLQKTRIDLEAIADAAKGSLRPPEIIRASTLRHQRSKSECGPYSLFYIWARLHGVPPEYFMEHLISDALMFEFRQHLFADPSRPRVDSFDWDAFQRAVNIEWEAR